MFVAEVFVFFFWFSCSQFMRTPHFGLLFNSLLCRSVTGAPKLDVTWLRGNEPLHFLTPKMRTFEDSGVYSLVMTDVSEKEAGLYTCRASNAFGHVDTSATVGIVAPGSVRGGKPAMFVNRPDMDMAVAVGEDISVSFRVTGDPKPKGELSV
jgi:hypothetical protein